MIILYSVLTNCYDTPFCLESDIGNFCDKKYFITDNTSDLNNYNIRDWEILNVNSLPIDEYTSRIKGSKCSIDRLVKIYPYLIKELKDADILIYLDSRLKVDSSFLQDIVMHYHQSDWVCMKHRYSSNLLDEILNCYATGKISINDIKTLRVLFPDINLRQPVGENGILFRTNSTRTKLLSHLWLMSQMYISSRDQLSLAYARMIFDNNISFNLFSNSIKDLKSVTLYPRHMQTLMQIYINKLSLLIKKIYGFIVFRIYK